MEKIMLFCLSYAGSSATVYQNWKYKLKDNIILQPIELAGRGSRFKEPLYENFEEAVHDLSIEIKKRLTNKMPYAFFGYSMGSWLAFELAFHIEKYIGESPRHLFLCAKGSPYIHTFKKCLHKLPNNEFISEINQLGGTPNEVLNNKELLDIFIPILKSDYKIIETYNCNITEKLKCNLSVINGIFDNIEKAEIKDWKNRTMKQCKFYEYSDGHFFINNYKDSLIKLVNETMSNY